LQNQQAATSLHQPCQAHWHLIMAAIQYHQISRISVRAISQTALAGLGFMTGVILTLLAALAIWLIYRRRYGMLFEQSFSVFRLTIILRFMMI
jgi:hypothetical protein